MDAVKVQGFRRAAGFDGCVRTTQSGIHLGVGMAAMVAVAFGAAAFTGHGSVQRLVVMALAVGIGVALIPDWRHGAALGVIGYLLYLGFLVNSYGELAWHGRASLWEAVVFSLAFLLGLGQRWLRAELAPERDEVQAAEAKLTVLST